MEDYQYSCTVKELPVHLKFQAALTAIDHNPLNAPFGVHPPERIAVLATKYWGDKVKDITYGFMEPTSVEMRNKIDLYANKWNAFSKARFRWTKTDPMIRISFGSGGYWSYLGTDILSIPRNEQTMNLERFTVNTPDSEWNRVVPHEFGHSLGCPHEQQRKEIIALLDEQKVISYFMRTQGWSEQEVREQILVPLEDRSLMGASPVDVSSIMCYSFPGSVTKNGQPIPGGTGISPIDVEYFAKIYPKDDVPPVNPPVNPPTPSWADRVITVKSDGSVLVNGRLA